MTLHVAVGVIISPQGILLRRRPFGHHLYPSVFECPGGKQEPDESILDTLHRELLEEIGAAPLNPTPLQTIAFPRLPGAPILHYFLIKALSNEPYPAEPDTSLFTADPTNIHALDLTPGTRAILLSIGLQALKA